MIGLSGAFKDGVTEWIAEAHLSSLNTKVEVVGFGAVPVWIVAFFFKSHRAFAFSVECIGGNTVTDCPVVVAGNIVIDAEVA